MHFPPATDENLAAYAALEAFFGPIPAVKPEAPTPFPGFKPEERFDFSAIDPVVRRDLARSIREARYIEDRRSRK